MTIQISDHFTYKKLFRFVLPAIFMMAVTSVYGVIDGLFVSNFAGKTPFAAINLIMPFIYILGGTGFMLGAGGTALVSKVIGEGDREKANRYFTLIIIAAVALGIILTVAGILLVRPVSYLLGAKEDTIEHCVTYGRLVLSFTVFFMLQSLFQSFLAAAGKPKLGLLVTAAAGLTNAALDALFIVVFKWGIVGAAVATGIGQFVGGIIPVIYFSVKNSSLLKFTRTKIEIKPVLAACGNGSSELLTNVSSSIVSMLFNLQLIKYLGNDGVAAYGVLMYVQFIFLAIEIGFAIGSAPIIGFNYGAQNTDELKNIFKKCIVIMSALGIILTALAEALAVPLAKLFVGYDGGLYTLTVHAFRLFSFAFIFSGINVFSSSLFTALNNGVISAVISCFRALIFQIAYVLLLPLLFGVDGIWWAMFATELSAFIVSVIFFSAKRKKYNYA